MKSIVYVIVLYILATVLNFCFAASTFQLQATKQFVVQIVCDRSAGSGVIVDAKHVLTAAHVVLSQNCIVLDSKNREYAITQYKIDETTDLAMLSLDRAAKTKGVRFASKRAEQYSKVFTIGFPLNMPDFLTEGRYNSTYSDNFDTLAMPIIFGNSGGGIFVIEDNEIKLLAIVSAVKQIAITQNIVTPVFHLAICSNYKNTKAMYARKNER